MLASEQQLWRLEAPASQYLQSSLFSYLSIYLSIYLSLPSLFARLSTRIFFFFRTTLDQLLLYSTALPCQHIMTPKYIPRDAQVSRKRSSVALDFASTLEFLESTYDVSSSAAVGIGSPTVSQITNIVEL